MTKLGQVAVVVAFASTMFICGWTAAEGWRQQYEVDCATLAPVSGKRAIQEYSYKNGEPRTRCYLK